MHQHRVMRRLTDRPVKGMVTAGMLTGIERLRSLVRSQHFFVAPADQQAVDVGSPQRRQPRRLSLQQRPDLQQVEQRARLRTEQVHQRRSTRLPGEIGDERTPPLFGVDDAAPTQNAQAFAQGRT
ncbi:hypothetical protein D3C75_721700 [compost metagenome]